MTYTVSSRLDAIMARVDAWAEDNAGWNCREDAVAEAMFCLTEPEYADMSDDLIVDAAIAAWEMAE